MDSAADAGPPARHLQAAEVKAIDPVVQRIAYQLWFGGIDWRQKRRAGFDPEKKRYHISQPVSQPMHSCARRGPERKRNFGLLLADDACLLGVGTLPTDRPSPLDKLERRQKREEEKKNPPDSLANRIKSRAGETSPPPATTRSDRGFFSLLQIILYSFIFILSF